MPETQEVLQHLEAKAKTARQEGDRSPILFRNVDGSFLSMDMIRSLQDRQNGSAAGFTEVERLLEERIEFFKDKLQQLKQQEEERHGN